MFTLDDAREALKIYKYALDDMCAIHPVAFENVTEATALSIDKRDTKKDRLARILAKQARALRVRMLEKGEKPTEVRLEQEAILTREYREALDEYMEAKKEADLWLGMRDSYMQRGRALQDICKLALAGYFSEITIKSSEIEEVSYDIAKRNMSSQRKRLTNK